MLDVVSTQFNRFVQFAENAIKNGKKTAIATKGDVAGNTPLEERNIKATDKIDWVSLSFLRGSGAQRVNNEVRELFKQTVYDMFGGEKNVPDSVKSAMLMKDYGCGKPLTARRIIAVKKAIEQLGRINVFSSTSDEGNKLAEMALNAGYKRTDFGKLNTAANIYAKETDCTPQQALVEMLTAGTDANNLFIKSGDDFQGGLDAWKPDAQDLKLVRNGGSQAAVRNLADVAGRIADKYRHLLDGVGESFDRLNPPDGFKNEFAKLCSKCNEIAETMDNLASQLREGALTDRKTILETLFRQKGFLELANMLPNVFRTIKNADNKELQDAFKTILKPIVTDANSAYDKLGGAYKIAVAKDLAPSAADKLREAAEKAKANKGQNVSIPNKVFDDLAIFLSSDPFGRMDMLDNFCTSLAANGDAKMRFSEAQKQEIKDLFQKVHGTGLKCDIACERFIDEMESAFYAEAITKPEVTSLPMSRPDSVVAFLKANPDMIKLTDISLRLNGEKEVNLVKNRLKEIMLEEIADISKNKNPGEQKSLVTGVLPQTVREYSRGYVKFNGNEIPPQFDVDKGKNLMANTPDRRGFVDFLETKFDDNHKKMRQLVSVSCGMAAGLGGAIEGLIHQTHDKPGDRQLVGGITHTEALKYGVGAQGYRDSRDSSNITIDDNGDVTITRTIYVHTRLTQMQDQNGQSYGLKHLNDKTTPDIAQLKIISTMKIKNMSDAELGEGKFPDFDIVSIEQEQVKLKD